MKKKKTCTGSLQSDFDVHWPRSTSTKNQANAGARQEASQARKVRHAIRFWLEQLVVHLELKSHTANLGHSTQGTSL